MSSAALWFGLFAAPAAWALDELLQYFMASRLCGMNASNTAQMLTRADAPGLSVVGIVTFIIALAGLWVALSNWRQSREEQSGSGHHLIERGEGRTCFLAMAGLLTSCGFAVAFLFIFAQLYVAPLCLK